MNDKQHDHYAAGHEAWQDCTVDRIRLCSGFGQYHTNEPDPAKPEKILTAYASVTVSEIKALVDNPQQVDKDSAQWLIASTYHTRSFKEQEANGEYWLLWADMDKNPPPLVEIGDAIEPVLDDCDFELYNSRSATEENQKARLIVFLDKPLSFRDWTLAQQTLNDKLAALGIIPDRANERAAQLCYLPNRGAFYDFDIKRNDQYFDPLQVWADEIAEKRQKIEVDREALEAAKREAIEQRESLRYSDKRDGLIDAFNRVYTCEEILVNYGYDQRGNAFRHPNSQSGSYSGSINPETGRYHALSPNDPLYVEGDKSGHDAFSVFQVLQHNRDQKAALRDAGDNIIKIGSESWNKVKRRIHEQEKAKKGSEPPRNDQQTDDSGTASDQHKEQAEPKGESIGAGLTLRSMSEIQIKSIRWLWTGWIPRGYITLWAGESGAGKTSILTDIVARETTGDPWPGETEKRNPGRVLWLGSEDGMADLTKPRLIANGADCTRIDEICPHKNGKSFSLQDDILSARETLRRAKNTGNPYTLMVIDPVTSYLPGNRIKNVNNNDAGNVRAVLEPWLRLAEEFSIAIVCITHFSKDANRSLMARVLGSTAFVQTCRSLVCVVGLPTDEDPFSKGMIQVKNNLPQSPVGGWRLRTVKAIVGVDAETGENIEATKPEWLELDGMLTPESFMKTRDAPKYKPLEIFKAKLMELIKLLPDGIPEPQLREAVIGAGVSLSWWRDNNARYLRKFVERGVTYCAPSFFSGV